MADSISRIPGALTLLNPDTSEDLSDLIYSDSDSASEVGSEMSLSLVEIDDLKQERTQEKDIASLRRWIATETDATLDALQSATP